MNVLEEKLHKALVQLTIDARHVKWFTETDPFALRAALEARMAFDKEELAAALMRGLNGLNILGYTNAVNTTGAQLAQINKVIDELDLLGYKEEQR